MKEYKLPEVLSQMMKDKNISQNKLAEMMNTTQRSISDWIRCRATPSMFSLISLASVLNVSLDYLVYGEVKNERNNKRRM